MSATINLPIVDIPSVENFNNISKTQRLLNLLLHKIQKLSYKSYITFNSHDSIFEEIAPLFKEKGYFMGKYIDSYIEDGSGLRIAIYKYYMSYDEKMKPRDK